MWQEGRNKYADGRMTLASLACDAFKQLDVVLPNGDLVQATNDNEYKDLFLSLKGGGNPFGIVVGYHVRKGRVKEAQRFKADMLAYSRSSTLSASVGEAS